MKIKPKQIGSILLCILIGTTLISSMFILDASGKNTSLGLIKWGNLGNTFAPVIFLIASFMIGVGCGALVIYLTKIQKSVHIFLTSLFVGIITLFFYAIITLLANWDYLVAPRMQHYAWEGIMGYIGDALFLIIVVLFAFGIFILPGFIVGGAIQFLYKKVKLQKNLK
ncbi:MAG TPA: hypothetical protein VMT57_02235 [Candidatus Thermoplasmatota archaeon]|nr:hypothetical protein [Candidatus Thermoplasmatota archaeon]